MARIITTKYPARCADCGTELPIGTTVKYYGHGKTYGMDCHAKGEAPNLVTTLENAAGAAARAYTNYVKEFYVEPAFAVVDNASGDMFHNPGKPTKVVDTMFDVCGFVWVNIDNRRKNGAPGKRFLTEFKSHATPDRDGRHWRLGEFSLSHSGYDGSWHLGGYGADSVTGGTGNGAMSAAEAGANAFVAAMHAAGYEGLRMESRID